MTAPPVFAETMDTRTGAAAPTVSDRHQCRWHAGPGRCPQPQAFPGIQHVPELRSAHLTALEPWIAARAVQRHGQGAEWIA